ncbi:DUF1735 domain-containing protein [Sphingobacterium alkalisoli]|uniref:DUF1735 domain-containing protein n=1 Tax=Sphingobacterium alkalisoli TaxID=1874115 RepID=A0A4U0H4H2_9SPHI|nr:DUF5627 domain-containing protein [Sphingobacterium alkalisoli]TJY66585.1 DUF1735 domain-containing protein [Sphingobacterium alkalisoli]GGH15498.1 hypothetical protein GCM10011418_17240 [Sphingobacterium alkalisoli]
MKKKRTILGILGVLLSTLFSCGNQEIVHPDFDYQTVYFASQYPIRTLVLGEDSQVDNSLDNDHKVSIKAALGGTRNNTKQIEIGIAVEESLTDHLYFTNGVTKVLPMPSSYYKLESDKIVITPGNILGGVEVQLTDEFFADPLAIQSNYVIPLVMKNVTGADSILRGKSTLNDPNRYIDTDWQTRPQDYVLYVIKYVNTWHGNYLRRGVDIMTGDVSRNVTRHAAHVANDEVNLLSTKSLNSIEFPIQLRDAVGGNIFTCTLLLNFDAEGNCTVSTNSPGYTATGTGSFVKKGDKKSWGNQDRDVLYLDYQIIYNNIAIGNNPNTISGQILTKDTLVIRDRAVVADYFNPILK